MNQQGRIQIVLDQIRILMTNYDHEYLLVERQENFSWITGGRGFIGLASVQACGSILVGKEKAYLIASNIELCRLKEEQKCNSENLIACEYPWYEPWRKKSIIDGIINEKPLLLELHVEDQLTCLRSVLGTSEIEELREAAQLTARVLEEICFNLRSGIDEYSLAGKLSEAFWALNLEPITLLIGFDERAYKYRHPVPTGKVLENSALVAVCTRRNGLVSSATRIVSLRDDPKLQSSQKKVAYLGALASARTVVGNTMIDIFHSLVEGYAEVGEPDEWKKHHQGGLSGFLARELKADQQANHIVRANEVYAWNPSIKGAKAESTILVTELGHENLTYTGNFPCHEFVIDGKTIQSEDLLILRD